MRRGHRLTRGAEDSRLLIIDAQSAQARLDSSGDLTFKRVRVRAAWCGCGLASSKRGWPPHRTACEEYPGD